MSNDKVSPARVKKVIDDHRPERLHQEMVKIRQEGFQEGLKKGHQDIFEWLQSAYLNDSVERGTPEADAILKIARDAGTHFNPEVTPNRTKR